MYDTNSNYDTTNYRWTPNIAGYYEITIDLVFNAIVVGVFAPILEKNGSSIASFDTANFASQYPSSMLSYIVYMNGTTDYVEAFLYQNSGSNGVTLGGRPDSMWFQGTMIRGA